MLGAVELAGNEPAIPSQDGLWLGDQGHVRQIFPAETLADLSECAPLRVGESELCGEVGAEDSVLGDEVFALEEQALIDQTCHIREQSCPFVVLHLESAS
jgi:hypothetical protein